MHRLATILTTVFLITAFTTLFPPLSSVSSAYEGNCVCAGCDRPCGSGHASNCPYAPSGGGGGGGGGGGDEGGGSGGASFERAPIFVAPVGMGCGIIGGGVWYFKQMAGSFKDQSFLDSYSKFLKVDPSDQWAANSFTFGLRMGGIPWLALYLPTGPISYGISSTYKVATKPSPPKPKPVDPNIAVYELIARNYASLSATNDVELKKAQGDVEAARARRIRYLSIYIAGDQELLALKEKEGMDAALARAEKQLDAYSRARDEKKKIAATLEQSIREKGAQLDEAIKNANPASFLVDLKLSLKDLKIRNMLEDKNLSQGVKDSLSRDLKVNELLQNCKQGFDIGMNAYDIAMSYQKAATEGKDAAQWFGDREAREKMWRLQTKLLSLPLSAGPGIVAGSAEAAMDTAYAITAMVNLNSQIEAETATLENLRTARSNQDALADEWKQVGVSVQAAREKEEIIRKRGEQYRKMQKENEINAYTLRWK